MTAKGDIDFQKLDFINNNHCIVYAPNSTGKTRLTTKLSKKYVKEQAVFFTSAAINDMLSFSGRKIYVGSDSSAKLENDNIIKEFNKNVAILRIDIKFGIKYYI